MRVAENHLQGATNRMSTPRILYIEDKSDNRLLVRRILMAEDIAVLEAESADAGIALAKAEHPDLILMDINMPGKDGYTATNDIRMMPELDDIPILALTADVMNADNDRSMDAGCDGYIPN